MLVYLLIYYECCLPYDSVSAVFSSKDKLLASFESVKTDKFLYQDDELHFVVKEVELDDINKYTLDNPLSYTYYHKISFGCEELFVPFTYEIIGHGVVPNVTTTVDGSIYTINYDNTNRHFKKSNINPIILEDI